MAFPVFSLQILMSALPRCITAMLTLCVLTCLDPIVVTVSWDMSEWMISRVQVSSYVCISGVILCMLCVVITFYLVSGPYQKLYSGWPSSQLR